MVGTQTIGTDTSYGWDDAGNYSGAALTYQRFNYGYETFDLDAISLEDGTLSLVFDDDGAGDIAHQSTRDKLELHVGGEVFNLGNGSFLGQVPTGRTVTWSSTGLTWSANDPISLKIVENDTVPPALARQYVGYNLTYLKFGEDLVWHPTPDPAAFAVTVDGVARSVYLIGINGAKGLVRLYIALPAQPGETVAVSYAPPATNPIRDLAGNPAAGFSVTIPPTVTSSPPDAPEVLAAKAGSAQVTLTWRTPDNGGKTITGYEYRKKEGTGSFGNWTAIPNSGPHTTSYTVGNLTSDTAHTFEVRAKNGAGDGAAASASATPSGSETTPPALERAFTTSTAEDVRLLFDEVLDETSMPDPSAFAVTVDGASTDVIAVSMHSIGGANRILRLELAAATHFERVVVSYTAPASNPIKDLAGNRAVDFQTTATYRVVTPPDAPDSLTAEGGDGLVTLKWWRPYDGGKRIVGYEYRQKEGTGEFGNWTTIPNSGPYTETHTVPGLTNGTHYTFEVRADNGADKGAAASASATPAVPPPLTDTVPRAPRFTGLYVDDSTLTVVGSLSLGKAVPVERLSSVVSSFKVQWKSGSQQYDSSRQHVLDPQPASVSGAHSTAFVPSYTITGLTNGVEHTMRIIATNAYGDGPPSEEKSGTPNPKPAQLWQFIEDDIVEEHETSFPWLRDTWNYLQHNNVRLHVRNYGSSRVSRFCNDDQTLASCYVRSITITTDVVDGEADTKKWTILHELAHVYTLANGVSDTPAPLAMAHLYFGSLNTQGSSCGSSELYADMLASLVLGGSTTEATYWNRCTGESDSTAALAVVRSAAGGQEPSWSADTYNDSNGNPDLEQVWADLIALGWSKTVAFQLRDQFGGYCNEETVSSAIKWDNVARAVTRNPWKDGGCVPGAPTSLATGSAGDGKVAVSWNAPASDGGSLLRGYKVQWKSGDDDFGSTRKKSVWFSPWETHRPSQVSKTIAGLTNGVEYTFQVFGFNQNGDGAAAETTATPSMADTTAPELLTAIVERASLVLSYSEALEETSAPAASAFTVKVAGATRSVDEVSVEGSAVSLTLSSKVASGDSVTVSYAVPTDVNASRIQDATGNDAAAISTKVVTNNTLPVSSDATLDSVRFSYRFQPCEHDRRKHCPWPHGGLGTYRSTLSLDVDSSIDSITLWPDPANDHATVAYNPADADAAVDGYQASLSPGDNVITITVTAEDGIATTTYSLTITRSDNRPAAGVIAVSGMVRAQETLTASLFGIVDLDGLSNPMFSYQWVSNAGGTDTDIPGATGSTYMLAATDVGKTIKVRVTFADAAGHSETLTSAATASVEPALSEQGGETATEEPLTATFESLPSTHDGASAFSFVLRFSEDISISDDAMRDDVLQVSGGSVTTAERLDSASTSDWTITISPDGDGELLIYLQTGRACDENGAVCTSDANNLLNALAVLIPFSASVNTRATGLPVISGTAQVGETLTADTSGIADADGLTGATFTYQWVSNDGTTDTDIEDATSASYELAAADVGKTLKVRVTFTDDGGTEETLLSAATAAVAARAPDAPRDLAAATANGRESELDVSWTAPSSDGGAEVTGYKVQWKSGSEAYDDSASSTRQALVSDPAVLTYRIEGLTVGAAYTVRVLAVNDVGDGAAAEATGTAVDRAAPALRSASVNGTVLTLSFGEALDEQSEPSADSFAVTVADTARTVAEVALAGSAAELTLASAVASGETVTVGYTPPTGANASPLRDAAGNAVTGFTGEAVTNETTGLPEISGTPQVGETLIADISAITDTDGLTGATFAYQWLSNDGTADTEIAGATAATYEVATADAGRTIKVRVTFIDDGGTEETLVSAATASVPVPFTARVEDVPARHDGSTVLVFELWFSEEFKTSYRTVRDAALQVTGGTVLRSRRLNRPSNMGWQIHMRPETQGTVTIVLPADRPCGETGAMCTDDGRRLANRLELAIGGPASVEVSIAAGTSPVTEGAEAAFTLSRTGAAADALTVTVQVTESRATLAGTAPTEVTFEAGAGTAALEVATQDDEAVEVASTVTVALASGDGYTVAAEEASAAVTVEDDDAAPVVTTTSPILAPENGTAVATLQATDEDTPGGSLTWSIAGGTDAGAFTLPAGGALAFGAGKDYEEPDDADEDGEYELTVRVSDGANATEAVLTVRLTDVDEDVTNEAPALPVVSIVAGTSPVTEGTGASFTLSRTGAATESLTVTVSVTERGAAMLNGTPAPTVTFGAEENSTTLTVATDDDEVVETASTLTASVAAASSYQVNSESASAEVEVHDNDAATLSLSVQPAAIAEGESSAVTVAVAGGVTFATAREIALDISGGSAAAGDFTVADGGGQTLSTPYALTLAAGAGSVTATVTAVDDTDEEPEETIQVTASHDGSQLGTQTITVAPSDAPAAPEITSSGPFTVDEGTTAVATLTAMDADSAAGDLAWSIAGGADAGQFTLSAAGTLSLQAAKDFETPDDGDGDRTYQVTVQVSDGNNVDTANLLVTLRNVNEAPAADAGTDQTGISEGASVTLDGSGSSDPDAGDTLSYVWNQSDASGHAVTLSNRAAAGPTFTAPSGLAADATLELTLRVTDAGGLYAEDTVTVTVTALPEVSIAAATSHVDEGEAAAFTLSRTGPTTAALTVTVTVTESGAVLDGEPPGTVTFPTGASTASLTVATHNDGADEAEGTVTAALATGFGYRVSTGDGEDSASVTVLDDDDAPAPPQETTDVTVWSADMLVVDYGTGAIGAGTANLFSNTAGSTDLQAKWLWYYAPDRTLRLAFSDGVADAEELTLHVGDLAVAFPEGSSGSSGFTWDDIDVDWTDGQTLPVRLTRPAAGAQATGPTVTGAEVTSDPGEDGEWAAGDEIETVVRFSEPVAVADTANGTPTLGLLVGDTQRMAAYERGSGTAALTFVYTLTAEDAGATTARVVENSLGLNGATIRSVADGEEILTFSVADAQVAEAAGAVLAFRVTLNRAAGSETTVAYATAEATATAGEDYTSASGTLTFAAGDTEHTVTVTVLDDSRNEGAETLTLRLSAPSGAVLGDTEATGTIGNNDPMPRAWLARFGRAVAGNVLEAVAERLSRTAPRTQVTIAGHALPAGAAAPADREEITQALDEWLQNGHAAQPLRTMEFRELLAGSSFTALAAGEQQHDAGEHDDGRWTVWGRGAWTRFAGTEDGLKLDGDVVTGTVGADYEHDRLLAGLAVAHSVGDGTYGLSAGRSGEMHTTVTSVHPYVRLTLHERLTVWGLFGYALRGDLTLDEQGVADAIETDVGMLMGAFGARGTLLAAAPGGGFELAAEADGLVLQMRSEAAPDLVATTADVERLRLTLQSSYRNLPLLGGQLTPSLEVGGRYDGGAAETGAGLVVGGSLSYALPAWGLTLTGSGQGLLLHEAAGFSEWGAGGSLRFSPGSAGLGPSLRVSQSWGGTSTSAQSLWSLPDASRLTANDAFDASGHFDAEFSYGLAALDADAMLTPYAGLRLADGGARTARLGTRLTLQPAFSLSLEGARTESAAGTAAPDESLTLRGSVAF